MYVKNYGENLLKIKDEILSKTDDDMSEIEKLLVIHDALANRTSFDTDYLEENGNGGSGFLSSTVFGALNNKKAICLGSVSYTHLNFQINLLFSFSKSYAVLSRLYCLCFMITHGFTQYIT